MSYKAWMKFADGSTGTNGLAFATAVEADSYAVDLLLRWIMPTGFEIRESDEPVTDEWVEGKGLRKVGTNDEPHMPPRSVSL